MTLPHIKTPTTIVIFGVTGDLSRKKLLAALFRMYLKGYLPEVFRVVGFSRRGFSDEAFREFVRESLLSIGTDTEREAFLALFRHHDGVFDDAEAYHALAERLKAIDLETGQCSNKLFYLAVPPTSYETIFQNLAHSDLTVPCSETLGWTRILVEKPFGRDRETAQKLDALLGQLFKEEQIFRIDHYLAKETIQDILTFRFANTLFEPVWNSRWIEKVEVRLWENIDIAARGSFYNDTGALRDVGQNHLLQMLSLAAMEYPVKNTPDAIRAARTEVIRKLSLADENGTDLAGAIVRGQYEGFADGEHVPGDSETETYFKLKAFVDNERWQGVPFFIEGGKALGEQKVEIVVTFRGVDTMWCDGQGGEHTHCNRVTFSIQPKEAITVRFWSKRHGMTAELAPKDLSFDYTADRIDEFKADAYEKVLFDCIAGDQTLFASTDEIAASWAFITPILEQWHTIPLETYPKGSSGPTRELR